MQGFPYLIFLKHCCNPLNLFFILWPYRIKTCKVECNRFENEVSFLKLKVKLSDEACHVITYVWYLGVPLQDDPDLYFTDPQELLDLVTELTEQNLSLFHVSTNMENTLKELRRSLEKTKKKMYVSCFASFSLCCHCLQENILLCFPIHCFLHFASSAPFKCLLCSKWSEKDEEPVKMWINDMHQRINKEKARGNKLKQKVQILGSLDAEDEVRKQNVLVYIRKQTVTSCNIIVTFRSRMV